MTDTPLPARRSLVLPGFALQQGGTLEPARLVYRCFGRLADDGSNAILFPTYYGGTDEDNARLVGRARALDTSRYCVVVPNLFGNGVSSSPSNTAPPAGGAHFPSITMRDNVRAQRCLMRHLGIRRWLLVLGWSMGGVQAYQWCAQYPSRVERAVIICGAAATALHNQVFLEGVKAALKADAGFREGHYTTPPVAGLKAFARVYAGWAYSQAFFRQQRFRELGHDSIDALMQAWEDDHLAVDANDLLSMLATWQSADISRQPPFDSDLSAALQAIEADVWLMPCEQDLYFRHEDNRAELADLRFGRYRGFDSDLGHSAGGPGRFVRETAIVEAVIEDALGSTPSLRRMR